VDVWTFVSRLEPSESLVAADASWREHVHGINFPTRAFADFYEDVLTRAAEPLSDEARPSTAALLACVVVDLLARAAPAESWFLVLGGEHPLERMAPLLSTGVGEPPTSNGAAIAFGRYRDFVREARVHPLPEEGLDDPQTVAKAWESLPGSPQRPYCLFLGSGLEFDFAVGTFRALAEADGPSRMTFCVTAEGSEESVREPLTVAGYEQTRLISKTLSPPKESVRPMRLFGVEHVRATGARLVAEAESHIGAGRRGNHDTSG
jgi:hypothetical protein